MPHVALLCSLRADQTALALFFSLRLGRQTRWRGSARHCWSATDTAVPARRPTPWRDQKKEQENVGRTQRHPKADVVVAVVGLIPVAIGAARVVSVVVPRTAARHLSRAPDRGISNRQADNSTKKLERCAR